MPNSPGVQAVINAGLVLITVVAGFAVGRGVAPLGASTQIQMFRYYGDSTGVLTYGFACLCQKGPPSYWSGSGHDGCGGGSPTSLDKAYPLNQAPVPSSKRVNVPVPPGACCLAKPSTSSGPLPPPVQDGANCWVY